MASFLGGIVGSNPNQTTTTQSIPIEIPEELKPLISQTAEQITNLQRRHPLSSLFNFSPQPITGLSDVERGLYGQQVKMAGLPATTAPELAALEQINALTSGPIGSSPATLAALQNFEQMSKPGIEQDLALSGLARAGALPDVVSGARSAALLPMFQQEIQNRANVIPQLSGIGNTIAGRSRSDLATAIGAAGAPRDIAEARNQANFSEQQRIQNLTQLIGLSPTGLFGSIIPGAGSRVDAKKQGIWEGMNK